MKSLAPLLAYLGRFRGTLLVGTLWLVATTVLALVIPWMLKRGVEAIEQEAYSDLIFFAGVMAMAAVVRGATRIASRLHFLHTARRLEVSLRGDLLSRLLHQEGPFFDRYRTGDLLSRFTSDIANVRMLSGFGVMTMINAAVVYVLTISLMLVLSPSLTLVAVLPYPFMLLTVKYLSRHLLHHSTRVQEGMARVSEAVEEGVSGQAVIRAYGLAGGRRQRFEELNHDYLQRNLALARVRALVMPIMTVVGPVGTLLVLYFGGTRVIQGTLTLGDFIAFNAYLVQLAWPTLLLGWVLTLLQRAAASMERLQLLLHLPPLPFMPPVDERSQEPPRIEIRDLTFAYGEGQPILRDLSLDIPPGSMVGITGPTGAGKTTLLHLLARLYPVPEGSIWIDGRDLAALDPRLHRRRLTAVPQEGRLFSGSLRENLLYSNPEESESRLHEMVQQVRLAVDLEDFPEGYDSRVGEGGMSLSGGQRQRVTIGRALARDAGLWLLDDPFSHLDASTAREVWDELQPLLSGRTVILVSGRVSLLTRADIIIVLEMGRIRQQGRHDQLLHAGGLYARLYRREQLQDELSDTTRAEAGKT